MIPADVQALIDKARAMEVAHAECERNGGHSYSVDGFSRIAHPEVYWGDNPHVTSLSEIVFRAYVCRGCGRRVSIEEGRAYMASRDSERYYEAERRRLLESLWAQGYETD
jgi:hypothetical protein